MSKVRAEMFEAAGVSVHGMMAGLERVESGAMQAFFRRNGIQVSIRGEVKDSYHGPSDFDLVAIGEKGSYEKMKNSSVPEDGRWRSGADLPDNVSISTLSKDQGLANAARVDISTITELANSADGSKSAINRRAYKTALTRMLDGILADHPINQESLIISPLRAAGKVARLMGVSVSQQLQIEEKRLPLKENNVFTGQEDLAVGISTRSPEDWDRLRSIKDKEVTIVEGCVATAFTIKEILKVAEAMDAKPAALTVYAGAVTQQGVEELQVFCDEKGIRLEVHAGAVAYVMNENCYIMDDEGKYFVGDAGDFLWPGVGDVYVNDAGYRAEVIEITEDGRLRLRGIDGDYGAEVKIDPLSLINDPRWQEVLNREGIEQFLGGL